MAFSKSFQFLRQALQFNRLMVSYLFDILYTTSIFICLFNPGLRLPIQVWEITYQYVCPIAYNDKLPLMNKSILLAFYAPVQIWFGILYSSLKESL